MNHRERFVGLVAYRQSKLANVLSAQRLARHLADTHVDVFSLHPGVVRTEIGARHSKGWMRHGWRVLSLFGRAPEKAAAEIGDLAVGADWSGRNGTYLSAGKVCAARGSRAGCRASGLALGLVCQSGRTGRLKAR